jgi:hypothetical protein
MSPLRSNGINSAMLESTTRSSGSTIKFADDDRQLKASGFFWVE